MEKNMYHHFAFDWDMNNGSIYGVGSYFLLLQVVSTYGKSTLLKISTLLASKVEFLSKVQSNECYHYIMTLSRGCISKTHLA